VKCRPIVQKNNNSAGDYGRPIRTTFALKFLVLHYPELTIASADTPWAHLFQDVLSYGPHKQQSETVNNFEADKSGRTVFMECSDCSAEVNNADFRPTL